MTLYEWFMVLCGIALTIGLVLLGNWWLMRRRRGAWEFRCLEHQTDVTKWNAREHYWQCPMEGCDVIVEASTMLSYNGRKPPKK